MSNAKTYEEFLKKLQMLLTLSMKAIKEGGHLALLIGDFRRKGVYTCIARDIKDPPSSKFIQEIIKVQHNVKSDAFKYDSGLIRIMHEHVLVWRKIKEAEK